MVAQLSQPLPLRGQHTMATVNLYYLGLVCLLAVTATAASQCYRDAGQLKRVVQAQEECVRYLRIPCARLAVYNKFIYPNDAETQCMVRCMGLNLGWWNDTHGVQEAAMRSFFHPDPNDCDYERRTYRCLHSQRLDRPAPHDEACERAYESFRCYYEHYGNLVVTPQFVRLNALQQLDVLLQCADMVQYPMPDRSFSCAKTHVAGAEGDFDCVLRCYMLRTGLYSEQYGPNLDRIYVQCNNYANETLFRETTDACYQRLRSDCQDECTLIARYIRECFPAGGIIFFESLW
uniref:Uncharacterized protein n=1 Tax=Anopheles coluzzii TaxID=1518534 RepID=A0A6E8W365_ANOCL|nr:general odorant-binding protein 45-like [Anopheles coluzzii]